MKVLCLESINPVYRRNRIANVLKTAQKHQKLMNHWSALDDKFDKEGRKLAGTFYKKYGNDFLNWPAHAKDSHNKQFDKIYAKRGNAESAVLHNMEKRDKAYKIAARRYELPSGQTKAGLVPSNPLRKNRDETRGKHKITVNDMLKYRKMMMSQMGGKRQHDNT